VVFSGNPIVRHKAITILVYSLAAVAASLFWISRQQDVTASAALLIWLLLFAAPLLFVFAYPRFLFTTLRPQSSHPRLAAILHGLAATITALLFVLWGSQFWRNPMRDADSIFLLAVPIVAVPVFFVAALSLLVKNSSTLAKFASFLFWPYWLLLALSFVGRFFEATPFHTTLCFLCFVTPILFAFAAGTISYRPVIAHSCALAGLLGMPWICWTTLRETPVGNIWTVFNVPDRELLRYNNLRIVDLTIFSVGLIAVAIATAALRLLPADWSLRGVPLRERTWPAFGAGFLFLAIWFTQSVMPYRISGAVDFSDWPTLQILHVEKRGLQFHETCVSVWEHRDGREYVSFSGNDRRLFQYRFQQTNASGELSEDLKARIQSILQSSKGAARNWDTVKPLRAWNDDGWYFKAEGVGLRAYTTDIGTSPPQEIVDLFSELQKIPRAGETQSDRKDVCLGFCYDPLSGLGLLYANHRCRYDGHAYVCR
jgi:hypothetical protein